MKWRLLKVALVLMTAGTCLASAVPASASGAAGAASAARSPLDALPAGRAPRTVPYAIGTSVYYQGHRTDVRAPWKRSVPSAVKPDQRQLTSVVAGGGYAWAQMTGAGADLVHVVGRISPKGGWHDFQASTGSWSKVAVTPSGDVAMPEDGFLYRPDGRQIGSFAGTMRVICGMCNLAAAGPRFVVERRPNGPGIPHRGTWMWAPPAAPQQLPSAYRAVGRLGAGWVAAPDGASPGAECWRVAPAADPAATRARICSMTLPLVSADGTRAVVVQGGRVRLVDTRTGTATGLARLGALPSWSPSAPGPGDALRYLVPTAWENADSYLVTARDDRVLALVRCSARTGRCERAVRSAVRPGVGLIVTERGPAEIAPTR